MSHDVHVVCGKPTFAEADPDAVTNPALVVEVLSPSTERWDRGGKFRRYESVPSLREILLLEADERRAELFRRNDDGDGYTGVAVSAWYAGEGGRVHLLRGPGLQAGPLAAASATILAAAPGEWIGVSLSGGQDVDGDALADLAVGSNNLDGGAPRSGGAYLFFGPLSGQVSAADAGARLLGGDTGDEAHAVALVGDTDGDGYTDVLLGGAGADGAEDDAGAAWLFGGGGP